ncbi:MAG: phosphatidylglycerophosphatase A [Proteobacteria bacterium]|nr:phosphatidylglycerophosphatase A [Pseudomonadota bacterium]
MPLPPPRPAFLVAHPAHFIALGFGAGLAPAVQGTFGTLVAFPLAWLLYGTPPGVYLAVTALVFAIGVWASAVTGRALGVVDHGSIVIDEVAAFLLVLFFARHTWAMQLAAFLLFRVFDIVKPPPIGAVDARLKSGFGVMFDDILAAAYAIAVLLVLQHVVPW